MATSTLQHVSTHSRAKGHSSVAGAAYRLGEKLVDERTGLTHDYTGKGKEGVLETLHHLPPNADPSYADPGVFWNAVEAKERRGDARLCHDFRQAIPLGLDQAAASNMMTEYAAWLSEKYGTVATAALHLDNARDAFGNTKTEEQRGYHFHVQIPDRAIGEDGLIGPKNRELGNPKHAWKEIEAAREKWGELCNEFSQRHQLGKEFDHRSHERREDGIEAEETLGAVATAMERRGERSDRGDIVREQREEWAARKVAELVAQANTPEPQPDKTPIQTTAEPKDETRQLAEFRRDQQAILARAKQHTEDLKRTREASTLNDLKSKAENAAKQIEQCARKEREHRQEEGRAKHNAGEHQRQRDEHHERGRRAIPFFQAKRRREGFAKAEQHGKQVQHYTAEAQQHDTEARKFSGWGEGWSKTEKNLGLQINAEETRLRQAGQEWDRKVQTEREELARKFKALTPTNQRQVMDDRAQQKAAAEARAEAKRQAELAAARAAEQARQAEQAKRLEQSRQYGRVHQIGM